MVDAAWRPRVATGQATQGQPAAAQHSVGLKSLFGIGRARGVIAARLRSHRRNDVTVEPQGGHHHCEKDPPRAHEGSPKPTKPNRSAAWPRSVANWSDVAAAAAGSARITTRSPAPQPSTSLAQTARSRRETRCRVTALPTALLTMRPTRAGSEHSCLDLKWRTRVGREARRPRRTAAVKSVLRRIRWAAGSTGQAARRSRPLRRRAERMERPARVRILSRKPWVLARRRLLGWNVRFDTRDSEV